ncbi:MAG TPA: ribose-phosphate pyrophosphokinase, partial [Firmicutes bacterium]|nr:ribose-phosphate pyrophosphokinase [Bacillota bacterium]
AQPGLQDNKFKVLSVASLIGEAIVRIHEERSVSELFD